MTKFRLFLFSVLSTFAFNSFADIKADLKEVIVANEAAFAKADLNAFAATTTPNPTIIDEFEPFTWSGKNSSEKYLKDFTSLMVKDKLSDLVIDVKDATFVEGGKNSAYAVFPVSVSYKDAQMKVTHEEGFQTVTYVKSKTGKWLIKSSAWTTTRKDPN